MIRSVDYRLYHKLIMLSHTVEWNLKPQMIPNALKNKLRCVRPTYKHSIVRKNISYTRHLTRQFYNEMLLHSYCCHKT